MQETFEFLARGGPVMALIGLASVFALTIFIERIWALQRQRIMPRRFREVVAELLRKGKVDEAAATCDSNDSALGAILSAGLKHIDAGRDVIREAMQDRGRREAANLEKFTGALGAVANVAPLLGLLGTIMGMIQTFQQVNDTIVDTGEVSPGALASGIWEALLTTAAGLVVAIPTFIAYKFLVGRIDAIIADLEEISLDMVDMMVAARDVDDEGEEA